MCDLGVSDSKSSHSYPFLSACTVVWYFFFFFFFFGRNGVLCRVFCFYLIVQILFHSSLLVLVVEASLGIGMLASFVRSVRNFV